MRLQAEGRGYAFIEVLAECRHGFALVTKSSGVERDLDLVRATIDLGHALGLRIVAEGIEDQATLDLLAGLGCDIGQGYHIGMPKPASKTAFRTALAVRQ